VFCSKCGTDLPNDSQFCRKCGQSLSTGAGAAPASAPAKASFSWVRFSRLLGVFLAVGFILYLYAVHQRRRVFDSSAAASQTAYVRQPHRITIGNGAITVNAANVVYFPITVPVGATNVTLTGHFTASGGSGNDIEVFLLNQDAYTNWQNGHPSSAYYNSGKVTVADANTTLPNGAGTYYLVFNNKFSLFSPKAVAENFNLTYYQ